VQFQIGAVLQRSNSPSLRAAGFEDEDSGSTELAEVLPDEALRSVVGWQLCRGAKSGERSAW